MVRRRRYRLSRHIMLDGHTFIRISIKFITHSDSIATWIGCVCASFRAVYIKYSAMNMNEYECC